MAPAGDDIEAARQATEEYLPEYLPGFTDFSYFIASDDNFSIYKKFATLGARNLAYLQAELQELENQLDDLDRKDLEVIDAEAKREKSAAGEERKLTVEEKAARSWPYLQRHGADPKLAQKFTIISNLRILMKEYEEALLRRKEVLRLKKPDNHDFNAFKVWFCRPETVFAQSSSDILDHEDDMVTLASVDEPDRMSTVLHHCLGYRLQKKRKRPRSWEDIYYYPEGRVALVIGFMSILIYALLLVGAIMALHFVKPMGIRLGLIGVFTTVFAGSMIFFTNARRNETYGAAAGYAAVLVVFISVNN